MRDPSVRINTILFALAAAVGMLIELQGAAFASTLDVSGAVMSSSVNGVNVGAGTYTIQQLSDVGNQVGIVSADGFTGVSLWGLLGGNATGTASDVVTSTPPGDNGKNAILRYFVLATSAGGSPSIVSLGEIDPFCGGTSVTPDFVAAAGPNGLPALIFPQAGAAGRDIFNLTGLQVLAVPALPNGPGGESSSLTLSGLVANPGSVIRLEPRPRQHLH